MLDLHGRLSSLIPFGYASFPLHVCYTVGLECNLNCKFCYEKEVTYQDEFNEKDRVLLFKRILSMIPRWSLLTFSGGEPLLSTKILEIMQCAASRMKITLITNGTLLTEKHAKSLIKMGLGGIFGKGLISIDISVHGDSHTHNLLTGVEKSYEAAVEGIDRVLFYKKETGKKFPLINLRCVITKYNYLLLEKVVKLGKRLKVDTVIFELLSFAWLLKDDFKEGIKLDIFCSTIKKIRESNHRGMDVCFSPQLAEREIIRHYLEGMDPTDYRCFFPRSRAIITCRGEVFICPKYLAGNLRESSLSQIWNSLRSRIFRTRVKVDKNCSGCGGLKFIGSK